MSPRSVPSPRAMLLAVLVSALMLTACTRTPEPVLAKDPRPQQLPLRIGVYHSPELQDFTYKHHLTDIGWVLGKPSVQLLNDALALLFIDVVGVPKPGSPSNRSDLAGTIAPRIVSADAVYCCEVANVEGRASTVQPVQVTYGFTMYSQSGKPVASWEVTGRGNAPLDNGAIDTLKKNFERAMAEAARNFVSGFGDVPEVRTWLAEQGIRKD